MTENETRNDISKSSSLLEKEYDRYWINKT